jgi:RNA polymerase-binding transcription factor DksA
LLDSPALGNALRASDDITPLKKRKRFEVVTAKKKEMKKNTPHGAATAAAILGRPVAKAKDDHLPKKVKAEWQTFYARLLELREQLLRQMDGLAKESAEEISGYSLHMADSGTDNFDRDFALSLLSSDQDAIYEIEEALKRIEKDTYGVCELTGKPIPKAGAARTGGRVEIAPPRPIGIGGQWRQQCRSRGLRRRTGRKADQGKGIVYAARNHYDRVHGSAQGGQISFALHDHSQ